MIRFRKHILRMLLGIYLFASSLATAAETGEMASKFQCDRYWSGPAILLPGGLLPLPRGYALVDRTARPHIFRNFVAAVLDGGELGNIHVGFTPDQHERVAQESEFRVRRFIWNGIQREKLHHVPTGQALEVFIFVDGVMMEFSGAALPFAEVVASCYLELASTSVDAKRSNSRT